MIGMRSVGLQNGFDEVARMARNRFDEVARIYQVYIARSISNVKLLMGRVLPVLPIYTPASQH